MFVVYFFHFYSLVIHIHLTTSCMRCSSTSCMRCSSTSCMRCSSTSCMRCSLTSCMRCSSTSCMRCSSTFCMRCSSTSCMRCSSTSCMICCYMQMLSVSPKKIKSKLEYYLSLHCSIFLIISVCNFERKKLLFIFQQLNNVCQVVSFLSTHTKTTIQ